MELKKLLLNDPVFIFGLVVLIAGCRVAIGAANYALVGNKKDKIAIKNLEKAKCIRLIGVNFYIVAYLLISSVTIF